MATLLSRLGDLITAIGADIKALYGRALPARAVENLRFASQWGIVHDPTLAVDQTSALQAMVNDLRASQFGGTVIMPDGDVCYTGPIDWSGCGSPGKFYYQASNTYREPPKLQAMRQCRLRMLNAVASNVTGMVWSATQTDVDAGITRVVYPSFENIAWYGPGVSVTSASLASNASGTSISLVGTPAAAGDAIAMVSGSLIHWATVLSVAGSGPQTVTISSRQALLQTWTTGATKVLLFKQTRLVQFGGTLSTQSTVVQQLEMHNCEFHAAFQGICLDDTTGSRFEHPIFKYVVHCISHGYNIDTQTVDTPYVGTDRAQITATCTNGSATIVCASSGVAAGLKPGELIWESPNADGTLNFPENTTVLSVSGVNVTLSENYGGTTGSKVLNPGCGTLHVAGQGASAFLPAFAGNSLSQQNQIFLKNPLLGRARCLFDIADVVGNGYFVDGGYLEASQRIGIAGRVGLSGSGGPWVLPNFWVQDANSCTGPAFDDLLGASGARWDIGVISSGTARFPVLRSKSYNVQVKLRQGWIWDNQSTAPIGFSGIAGAPTVTLATDDNNTHVLVGTGNEWVYNIGTHRADGGAYITKSHSGALNWNWPGHAGLSITMTGNITAGSIIYGVPPKGYPLRIILTQGGSGNYTADLGSDFVRADGVAIGTIAGAAVGKVCVMNFISTGTKLVLTSAQAPTFEAEATLSGVVLTEYKEKLTTITTSGNITISLANGPLQRITLDAARQISMPADPGAYGVSFTLIVRCQGFSPTWGSSPSITWIDASGSGAAPTLNTVAGKQNLLTFVWDDNAGGTGTWLGFFGGKAA